MKPRRHIFRPVSIFSAPLHYGAPIVAGFMVFISGLDSHAGDILRGGGAQRGKGGIARRASNIDAPTPDATDAARANARDMLVRTNRTMAAMRAMQNAARNAANKGPNNLGKNPLKPTVSLPKVPNGLVAGGLKVSGAVTTDPSKWKGAKLPTQVVKNGRTKVTVKQTEQQALLEWETFNIGKNTTLTFDQKKGGENVGQWIAFNKVSDPTANPTQILGNIKADGQVYIINPNGIIFGGSSQVNTRGLTASSLPINDNLIERGLLNNPDAQFLFSGLDIAAGINGTPAFVPDKPLDPSGKYGDVIVQAGAVIKSPTNSAKVGGRVSLVGPNIINNGTILTPDGQTILAAGLQVGFDGHASSDPSLRGLDVFVGAVEDPTAGLYAGTVTQTGLIESQRGNISLAGRSISQGGMLYSTTSVALNGRIDIEANFNAVSNRASASAKGDLFLFRDTGSVELLKGSVMSILPDYASKETAIGTELALRSQANITGRTIHFGEDSLLAVSSGEVTVSAGKWVFETSPVRSTFLQAGGQVYLDRGARIDVSGSTSVTAPVSQNIVEVDLRGAELADSPLQRLGKLRNQTIYVDIRDAGIYQGDEWLGTPLANVAGFANLIQRDVGQLTVAGGNVNISAGGSVVLRKGSSIDVSGGSTSFEGGMVRTTQLITDGRLVDISQATPDVVYDGLFDGTFTVSSEKYGISKIYHSALAPAGYRYDAGSTEGAAGGKLSISAPSMALDGKLLGKTFTGEKQRLTPPSGSTLSLVFSAQDPAYPTFPTRAPAPPVITFSYRRSQAAADAFTLDANGDPLDIRTDRRDLVVLSSDIFAESGFDSLEIDNHDGEVIVPEAVHLKAPTGGAITFEASNITILGSVTARGGSLEFNTFGLTLDEVNLIQNSPPAGSPPVVEPGRGIFTLGSTGRLDTSGLLVDDREFSRNPNVSPVVIDGGSVSIQGYSAKLAAGGLIDVSGGASISPKGAITYGDGGSLKIAAGRESGFSATLGGTLTLDSVLKGFSGADASKLQITGAALQIGGSSPDPRVTVVDPARFADRGFGNISLTGVGLPGEGSEADTPGLLVTSGTRVNPAVTGWLAKAGEDGNFHLRPASHEEGERSPVDLTLSSLGASFGGVPIVIGSVVSEKGSVIRTDAGGSISIKGHTVTIHGSLISPGGTITVTGATSYPSATLALNALPTVHLSSSARLSTAGTTILLDDPFGRRTGDVLSGGDIAITGNIVAENGAVLDVSGTRGVLDLPATSKSLDPAVTGSFGGKPYVPVTIESNAGSITLTGTEMLFSDATLTGRAGGGSATGGTVIVSSGRYLAEGASYTTADPTLFISQNRLSLPSSNSGIGVGTVVTGSSGAITPQQGYFSISDLSRGGIDSLTLGGSVKFEGDVSIHLPGTLRIASGGAIHGEGNVSLSAGHIRIGQDFRTPSQQSNPVLFTSGTVGSSNVNPHYFTPTHGAGKLDLSADLIDIGDLSLEGIGIANLDARNGDIRGNGTLQMAGELEIRAGQIYPPTQCSLGLFVYDHAADGRNVAGSVVIRGGDTRSLPLSAGGTLSVHASKIVQDGVLRAPFGEINLGWDGTGAAPVNPIAGSTSAAPVTANLTLKSGSITSVSAIDPITRQPVVIPYGISFDGSSWIDPAGNDITVGGAPEKKVNLAAVSLTTEKNSKIDIRGGGDLYAYRWIQGNGGTQDVLAESNSFAIIPGYGFDYSPYAPFNDDSSATKLEGESGYANSSLKPGDQITLAAGDGVPAGTYTLLPARYALLPGAYLITPRSGSSVNQTTTPEGASLVSGYRANNLNPERTGPTTITRFEVASAIVVRERAEYQDLLANMVLREAALLREFTVPRLSLDSGYLSFTATADMSLNGRVSSKPADDIRILNDKGKVIDTIIGRGGLIDINSSSDIVVNRTGRTGTANQLALDVSQLNAFSAESLLIGGLRTSGSSGSTVSVSTDNLTIDNSGTSLSGSDIILVSNGDLKITAGSSITSEADTDKQFESLIFGDPEIAGSGAGTLVRVSANASGGVLRNSPGDSLVPWLAIGRKVDLTGGSIVLDSTAATSLSSSAALKSDVVSLNSGQISVVLNNPGKIQSTRGLVISGNALKDLQRSASQLSLVSYSSLDTYGSGTIGSADFETLSIQAGAIRGFNTGSGAVRFRADSIGISNSSSAAPLSGGASSGTLRFTAKSIQLGSGITSITGFGDTVLSATNRILTDSDGTLKTEGNLLLESAEITGSSASDYKIIAGGRIHVTRLSGKDLPVTSAGLGAFLSLTGSRVDMNGNLSFASGLVSLRATTGDIRIGNDGAGTINLDGLSLDFGDITRHTGGGGLKLVADKGSVLIDNRGLISVQAPDAGGDAGLIDVRTPFGRFQLDGTIKGGAGAGAATGSFSLDTSRIAGGDLSDLDGALNAGEFNHFRNYRIRTGDVTMGGTADASTYQISADSGSLTVSGTVNASGKTGGSIHLSAHGSLLVLDGALLDASASVFDNAGKGGAITLEAGNQNAGTIDPAAVLDIRTGSVIDLSVSANTADSSSLGMFTGKLHLRAPRNAGNTDLAVESIGGNIKGASAIVVEGVKLYQVSGAGTITTAIQNLIKNEAASFLGAAGTTTAGYTAMMDRLTAIRPGLDLVLAPGAEVHNPAGDLVLGATNSTASSDWNLQSYRFGPLSTPGVLTLRASGDIVLYNTLSDGFAAVTSNANSGNSTMWLAPLMARNKLLPANLQSWSYRITSGADFSSADFRSVLSESELEPDKGSFLLGKNYGNAATYGSGANHTTSRSIAGRYQVLRTGSGDIDIQSGRDIHILNQFASIYSAGTVVSDPTSVITTGDFVVPLLLSANGRHPNQGSLLGAVQQPYYVQYSMAGGNVSLAAVGDIARKTRDTNSATGGNLIDDSTRQLPNNWLYRRGYIDPLTGKSGVAGVDDGSASLTDPDASTTWWVDFSNFFQGVGALGGGNVLLSAGNDVKNVDAVAPTNARMASGAPSASKLVELGGGDVTVTAGNNIDGGVYYVERGSGILNAGSSITTNWTRSPSRGIVASLTAPLVFDSDTWLPTSLFLGKGSFDVRAGSDLLLGPVANTFLLPQGLNNKFWYKTWFSTYAPDSVVNVTSLGGTVTHRTEVSLPSEINTRGVLDAWLSAQQLLSTANGAASFQPWLRLAETTTSPFGTLSGLMAPSLRTTALGGDINLTGNLTLASSPSGQLEIAASGSIFGLQSAGVSNSTGVSEWITSTINLSDSDPSTTPGISTPYAYLQVVGRASSANRVTAAGDAAGFLGFLDGKFTETGSSSGVLEEEQSRHTPGGLHSADLQPVRIIARDGNIEGITLFSPKHARIHAGNDIGDVSFYIQNLHSSDVSVVSAGRDLIAYNANTASRALANSDISNNDSVFLEPLAGDLQVSGPGNLQVLAGRTLDLGLGSSNPDGTGVGISSIGNNRNPYLGFGGASLTVGAGIGSALSLSDSRLAFDTFVKDFVKTDDGRAYLRKLAPGVVFDEQTEDEQARLALEIFYLTLRDAGRAFNNPKSPDYQNPDYPSGFAAIKALFPKASGWDGGILTQSRDIRTRNGGSISIFAPGGGITMADSTIGNPLTPPGIVTESGGSISIFTRQSVDIGIGRIFTLRGGDAVIWSSKGDIAAGSSSRTVSAAPPTRVLIDPQSASVETDLAGLATGGGIGVLASVKGVEPGDVDLIAPAGIIDAGDAGIRVSGNINLAAVTVVNASNISAGGSSTGAPSAAVSAPSISTVTSAANATAASASTVAKPADVQNAAGNTVTPEEIASIYTVEVIGYGGGAADDQEEEDEKEKATGAPAVP